MSDIPALASITLLKAIDTTLLPNGSQYVVTAPGTGLPPCIYTLITSTLAETQPFIVRPNTYTTRVWAAQPGMSGAFAFAPNVIPPFIGYRWINTAVSPRGIYYSMNVNSTSDWKQV